MMEIQLKFSSSVPIYEQIKRQIKLGIAKEDLIPGERLPSVRMLASDIGINLHTVNKAYQQLEQEGFLLIHRQRGVIIHPDGPPTTDKTHQEQLKETLEPLIVDAICRNMTKEQFLALCEEIVQELEGGKNDD